MRRAFILVLIFTAGIFAAGIGSVRSEPVKTTNAEAELVTENKSVQPGAPFWVALRLKPRKGWHTYWRYPGDSGLQTKIAWQLPPGFQASPIQWPAPEKITLGPLASYGYHDEIMLLTKITAPHHSTMPKEISLRAKASWLVCEKICVPEEAALQLSLPVTKSSSGHHMQWHQAFNKTRRSTPQPFPWPALFTVQDQTIRLTLKVPTTDFKSIQGIQFFPTRYGLIKNAAPQRRTSPRGQTQGQTLGQTLTLTRGPLVTQKTAKISGVLVLTGQSGSQKTKRAYELTAIRYEKAL